MLSAAVVELATTLGPRRAPPPAGPSPWLLLLLVGVCFLAVGLAFAFLYFQIRAFRREMGAAISALGLAPMPWMMRGVQARGVFRGRPIELKTLPAARYTPAMLEVKLPTRTARSLVVGPKKGTVARAVAGFVSALTDRVDVPLGGPWLERGVSADDPAFASAFLQGPAGELAYRLSDTTAWGQVRFLKVTPGEVTLLVSGNVRATTSATSLLAWVTDLAGVAEALERS